MGADFNSFFESTRNKIYANNGMRLPRKGTFIRTILHKRPKAKYSASAAVHKSIYPQIGNYILLGTKLSNKKGYIS